jgi:hypothetical protein
MLCQENPFEAVAQEIIFDLLADERRVETELGELRLPQDAPRIGELLGAQVVVRQTIESWLVQHVPASRIHGASDALFDAESDREHPVWSLLLHA